MTYSIADEQAIFSGDVLFQGSVGRTDLPGGDWGTLLSSIGTWSSGCRLTRPCIQAHGNHRPRHRAPDEPVPRRAAPLPVVASFQAPRGTYDLLPEEAAVRR